MDKEALKPVVGRFLASMQTLPENVTTAFAADRANKDPAHTAEREAKMAEIFAAADADGDGKLNEAEHAAFIAGFTTAQREKYGEWIEMPADDCAILYAEVNKNSAGEGISMEDLKAWRTMFRECAAELAA